MQTELKRKWIMRNYRYYGFLILSLLLLIRVSSAQDVDNDFQARTELELVIKPIKDLKLSFIPQLRFEEDLSLDKYLLETEVEYIIQKLVREDLETGYPIYNIKNLARHLI